MFLQARRLVAKQQNVNVVKRTLRTTTKRKNNMFNQILEGDSGKGLLSTKFYHYTVSTKKNLLAYFLFHF